MRCYESTPTMSTATPGGRLGVQIHRRHEHQKASVSNPNASSATPPARAKQGFKRNLWRRSCTYAGNKSLSYRCFWSEKCLKQARINVCVFEVLSALNADQLRLQEVSLETVSNDEESPSSPSRPKGRISGEVRIVPRASKPQRTAQQRAKSR